MQLSSAPVTVMLPVIDLGRARDFYEHSLGLAAGEARADGKYSYHCGATTLALFPKDGGTRAEHTAVSFEVHDIHRCVAELQARGVVFEDYTLPGLLTVDHICELGAERAAWFKDTEGNILCLHEERPA